MSTDSATHPHQVPTLRRRAAIAHAAVATLLLAACASSPNSGDSGASPPRSSPTPADNATSTAAQTPVRITIGDTVLTGHLFDNATANDLASQLPLTLTFRDLNGEEKIAPLPRKLSTDGMPEGDDPEIGDIGYWAPDGNLVLYYGDVGYWRGIMRIGRLDGDVQPVASLPDDARGTVERAQ